jgi:hypothetical protein
MEFAVLTLLMVEVLAAVALPVSTIVPADVEEMDSVKKVPDADWEGPSVTMQSAGCELALLHGPGEPSREIPQRPIPTVRARI